MLCGWGGNRRSDCLYTGISSGPNARYWVWESLYLFNASAMFPYAYLTVLVHHCPSGPDTSSTWCIKPKLHFCDLLWICCTTDPQHIEHKLYQNLEITSNNTSRSPGPPLILYKAFLFSVSCWRCFCSSFLYRVDEVFYSHQLILHILYMYTFCVRTFPSNAGYIYAGYLSVQYAFIHNSFIQ